MLFYSNYDKFKFLYVGGSHASTLECLYDCLLDIMFLFCRNKLILILILILIPQQTAIVQPEETLQHGLANGNAGGAPPPDAGPNPQDSGPTQPPRSTTCKFYAQGTCKHGRCGLSCQYNHPRMCKSFIKSGVRGCKRGPSCSFFHPRLCPQSLHHNQCIRKRCFLYQVTGSERPNYSPAIEPRTAQPK